MQMWSTITFNAKTTVTYSSFFFHIQQAILSIWRRFLCNFMQMQKNFFFQLSRFSNASVQRGVFSFGKYMSISDKRNILQFWGNALQGFGGNANQGFFVSSNQVFSFFQLGFFKGIKLFFESYGFPLHVNGLVSKVPCQLEIQGCCGSHLPHGQKLTLKRNRQGAGMLGGI